MYNSTGDRLKTSLIDAGRKETRTRRISIIGGSIFAACTALAFFLLLMDSRNFFINTYSQKVLCCWIAAGGLYIILARQHETAVKGLNKVKEIAVRKINSGLCEHDEVCQCRMMFLKEMEDKGISLHW
ncbi:MAG: hypothetical protein ACM3MK_07390 [Chitinophagales bacterium]